MKFSKQRTLSECGPRAIHNALIYLNKKKVLMSRLHFECQTSKHGSSDYPVYRSIKKHFEVTKFTTSQMLASAVGSCFIVGYDRLESNKTHSGHYLMVVKETSHSFKLVNFIAHNHFNKVHKGNMSYFKTEKVMSTDQLRKFLKPPVIQGIKCKPLVYLVK